MARINDFAGKAMLRLSPLIARLKKVPLLRPFLRSAAGFVLPPNHRVWVQVTSGAAEGLHMKLNPRTQGGFYASAPDIAFADFLRQHLRPGMTFWDLGANQGIFSLVAAKLVGPSGKVLSFEPDPELVQRLAEHAVANKCSNIRVIHEAVGAAVGSVIFDRQGDDCGDFGQGKIVSYEPSSPQAGCVSVKCTTLDDLLQHETPPDFVKCDVEGAEVDVFQAGQNLLGTCHPYIECEVHSSLIAETLPQFIEKFGYSIKWYAPNHFLAVPASRDRS